MTASAQPKITVYIPCRHYGRYLRQAIESVLKQTLPDWELVVVDDGSEDETARVAGHFREKHPERIRVIRHAPARGLPFSANTALEAARGEYILRLDADDFLDENALLVLSSYLDRHPEVALVYPNFIYVDEAGSYLNVEQRKRVGEEAKLLDLPAHGAGTMARKRVLKSLGGYDESYGAQDGYELWLKVLPRHGIANVATPLFFYRQHGASQSRDQNRLLEARRQIKQAMMDSRNGRAGLRIAAIVQAKNTYAHLPNVVLREMAGSRLIDYTLEAALRAELFEKILVTTDDPEVVRHCRGVQGISAMLRSSGLSGERTSENQVALDATTYLERELGSRPDILVLLSVHAPLRTAAHIREAVNTLILYGADSVVSVCEDVDLHFVHGPHGLAPLNPAMHRQIRLEREGLYESNGAVRALWRRILAEQDLSGTQVGHIVMARQDSFQIKTPFDLQLIEYLLQQRAEAREKAVPSR